MISADGLLEEAVVVVVVRAWLGVGGSGVGIIAAAVDGCRPVPAVDVIGDVQVIYVFLVGVVGAGGVVRGDCSWRVSSVGGACPVGYWASVAPP